MGRELNLNRKQDERKAECFDLQRWKGEQPNGLLFLVK